jgi:hypothetical protein
MWRVLPLFLEDGIGPHKAHSAALFRDKGSCVVWIRAVFLPSGLHWLKITAACLGRMGITMAFEIVCLVSAELYPTFIRCV